MCYGAATISRLLKIRSLFCKRALQKKLYSAKKTYNSRMADIRVLYDICALLCCMYVCMYSCINMCMCKYVFMCVCVCVCVCMVYSSFCCGQVTTNGRCTCVALECKCIHVYTWAYIGLLVEN